MALSGSLNFLTAGLTGSENINIDFVRLNTLIVDPVSSSSNTLGLPSGSASTAYYNSEVEAQGGPEPNQLNSLLLNRNGPYQHGSWKQLKGASHPIAKKFRLQNTMSIDISNPREKKSNINYDMSQYPPGGNVNDAPGNFPAFDHLRVVSSSDGKTHPQLKNYYEPAVVSHHKPLMYNIGDIKVRHTLTNETSYFLNSELNQHLKLKQSPAERVSGSLKTEKFSLLSSVKRAGAGSFVYCKTIFPSAFNTYRKFNNQKLNYMEVAGTGSNGYDRATNRSFWTNTVGGGSVNATSDSTTRLRTEGVALNSQNTTQSMFIEHLTASLTFGNNPAGSTTGSGTGSDGKLLNDFGTVFVPFYHALDFPISGNAAAADSIGDNHKIDFIQNGISTNHINTLTGGVDSFGEPNTNQKVFVQKDAYQPYPITLLSKWPLEVRSDVYDKPAYLTASFGGKGLMIGATPHSFAREYFSGSHASVVTGAISLLTRSAGELVYSTKPTQLFRKSVAPVHEPVGTSHFLALGIDPKNSAEGGGAVASPVRKYDNYKSNLLLFGYSQTTASLQFHRHVYPYNTPFWATHKIIGRNPMYDSYEAFIGAEFDTLFKEYSIIPEFRISDHLEYYSDYIRAYELSNKKAFSVQKRAIESKQYMIKRAAFADPLNSFSTKKIFEYHKLNFLSLDGADHTASSDITSSLKLQRVAPLQSGDTIFKFNQATAAESETISDTNYAALVNTQNYRRSQEAVNFYSKYSHTDSLVDFSNLTDGQVGLFNAASLTVPQTITFECDAVKKLLPYDGFYPVTRTVQIGQHLKQAFGTNELLSSKAIASPKSLDLATIDEKLQILLEKLMAPGSFYNSIKSGIAVDYPIIRQTDAAQNGGQIFPTPAKYYVPNTNLMEHNANAETYQLSASFGYGGMQMLGAAQALPGILKKQEAHAALYSNATSVGHFGARLPFEYLRSVKDLKEFFKLGDGEIPNLTYLENDFVSPTRNIVTNFIGSSNVLNQVLSGTVSGQAWNFFIKNSTTPEPNNFGQVAYENSIQNYLAESMEFFLDDLQPSVKMPIIYSNLMAGDITFDIDKTYHAAVTLEMGKDQVMCEGPRNAGLHISSSHAGKFKREPSLRGYLYGMPTEIIDPLATNFTTISASGEIFSTSDMNIGDPEQFYMHNLQDPAYQAYTPPYFYGKSSLIFAFNPESPVSDLSTVFAGCESTSGSLLRENYDLVNDLARYVPTAGSLSNVSENRMKINASVDIFNPLANFFIKDGQTQTEKKAWYIAPKWVCPVLDFSSSLSAVEQTTHITNTVFNKDQEVRQFNLLENTYHDETTGKSMWGGYGTDPYDSTAMNEIYRQEGKDPAAFEKGIYLTLEEAFASERPTVIPQQPNRDDLSKATSKFRDIQNSELTSVTASLLSDIKIFDAQRVPIGKFASSKTIHEAVAIIPYFERPIDFPLRRDVAALKEYGSELYRTREIIPGKHFLPINKGVFENILNIYMINELVDFEQSYGAQENVRSVFFGGRRQDFNSAMATDTGKMIKNLVGDPITNTAPGFQLPPEFDFIHNSMIDPFQIIVLPFSEQLQKQDLINIYQGIMPEISVRLKREISRLTITPTAMIDSAAIFPPTRVSDEPESINLSQLKLANFLSPEIFLNRSLVARLSNGISSGEAPDWTPKDFYENIKFMTFKIKRRSIKNYDIYKERQIALGLKDQYINQNAGSERLIMADDTKRTLNNIYSKEIYGSNWPYDNFSLLEAVKIDIKLGVGS